jgi:hypothetical protein
MVRKARTKRAGSIVSAVAYVRTVKTASGARAVQIVHSQYRGSRDIEHIPPGQRNIVGFAARQEDLPAVDEVVLHGAPAAHAGHGDEDQVRPLLTEQRTVGGELAARQVLIE